jgi:hypothetical protein
MAVTREPKRSRSAADGRFLTSVTIRTPEKVKATVETSRTKLDVARGPQGRFRRAMGNGAKPGRERRFIPCRAFERIGERLGRQGSL